jgi:ligand-binding SRPBCC domain-containing protein
MQGSATVHIDAPPEQVWALVSDITNTGRFSPETFEAEWVDGFSEPAVGARFRGHVRRNGRGPVYWTTCTITACERGREFAFAVGSGPEKAIINWSYKFEPIDGGTDATESFALADNWGTRAYWKVMGRARGRTNAEGMRETLERIKAAAEGTEPTT